MTTASVAANRLILASTSPFRKTLLTQLQLPFETFAPEVDETPQCNETSMNLVMRLAQLKAQAAQSLYPQALSIGADQVAILDDSILGKPGNHVQAVQQLLAMQGQQVNFLTGLCVFNTYTQQQQCDVVQFSVQFRRLTLSQIERYLHQEQPYHCAGSFKSEGLGIVLVEAMIGEDPSALIGLPLLRLIRMLEAEGVDLI
jgi:septum formation protein